MATTDELLDALMKDYKKPEDLIGENGLLKQLTKQLLERAMQSEMTVQGRLSGHRRYHGRQKGSPRNVVGRDRERQVLAPGGHGTEEPRRERYFHRLRGRSQGFSRSNRGGLSKYPDTALHSPHGTPQAELRVLETA